MRVSMIRFLLAIAILTVFLAPGCRGDTPASLEPEGSLEKINIFNTPSALQPGAVHAVGATGIYQLVEVVQQLRGDCGPTQVQDARIGMAQNIGGSGSSIITHILRSE